MRLRHATNYASGRMDRDLDWAACRNVRDLGGLPTSGGGPPPPRAPDPGAARQRPTPPRRGPASAP